MKHQRLSLVRWCALPTC